MPNENKDPEQKPAIRRGRGLRLSTEGAAAEAQAPAEPAAAPQTTPARRGRGLRLSTTATPPEAPPPPPPPTPAVAPLVRTQIATPAGALSYLSGGVDGGHPLIMLHGWGATVRIWANVAATLAPQRKLYLLDLPGAGATPARLTIPTLNALADELRAFVATLGLERFDLLGHGLGAAVAALVAGQQHRRVSRLALIGFGIRDFAPDLLAMSLARLPFDISVGMARPLVDVWQPFNRAFMQSPPMERSMSAALLYTQPSDIELWLHYLADLATADARAYMTWLTMPGEAALHAALSEISIPTLCIAGREDRIVRLAEAKAAYMRIPGSELLILDACGHMPMIEQPEALHNALREFFG